MVDGDAFVPTARTRSPWSPESLHGGAAAALLARAVERHDADIPMQIVPMTLDLLRPVPVAPLRIDLHTVRPGGRVTVIGADLIADGEPCVRMTALRLRDAALVFPPETPLPVDSPPPVGPLQSGAPLSEWAFEASHTHGCEVRYARGGGLATGRAPACIRAFHALAAARDPP